jgi:hypothetical protein
MISIVNGFICYSSCDAAKAKHGEDPAKKPGQIGDPAKAKPGQSDSMKSADNRDAAVTFGGALAGTNAVAASAAASGSTTASDAVQILVDMLA